MLFGAESDKLSEIDWGEGATSDTLIITLGLGHNCCVTLAGADVRFASMWNFTRVSASKMGWFGSGREGVFIFLRLLLLFRVQLVRPNSGGGVRH